MSYEANLEQYLNDRYNEVIRGKIIGHSIEADFVVKHDDFYPYAIFLIDQDTDPYKQIGEAMIAYTQHNYTPVFVPVNQVVDSGLFENLPIMLVHIDVSEYEQVDPTNFQVSTSAPDADNVNKDSFKPFKVAGGDVDIPHILTEDKGRAYYTKPNPDGGYAEYTVNIPTKAQYALWFNCDMVSQGNTFWVTIDDNDVFELTGVIESAWRWVALNNGDPNSNYLLTLDEGKHTIRVSMREDGAKLGDVLVTGDLNYQPGEFSPNWVNRDSSTPTTGGYGQQPYGMGGYGGDEI